MLDRTPAIPPKIRPVVAEKSRPLFSVMIPSYNCFQYLSKTIESVLCQDMGPQKMQITVVDDCSTDGDVEALVRTVGKGRVDFYQHKKNVGSLRNFETCLNQSKGHYIHLLHGDDFVKKGFYEEIEFLFKNFPTVGSAITNYNWINEYEVENQAALKLMDKPGIINNWLFKIASWQLIQPPAVVVKRSVYEEIGSFFGVHYGEDWEMWIRIASRFQVVYSPKCLATYRGGHTTNISSSYISSGKNIDDLLKVIEIVQDYLPHNQKKKIKKTAKQNFSISYAKSAYRLIKNNNATQALMLAKGSLRLSINMRNIYWLSHVYFTYIKNYIRIGKD